MADFNKAVTLTLKHEGGFTVDTGGRTMRGITEKVWNDFKNLTGRYAGIDVSKITEAMARDVYQVLYWPYAAGIQAQAAANAFFDAVVNMGPAQASKIAQRVLNAMGERLTVDGEAGPLTWAAINRNPSEFTNRFTAARIEFYKYLKNSNPAKYSQYLSGWIRRAQSFFISSSALGLLAAAGILFYLYKRG